MVKCRAVSKKPITGKRFCPVGIYDTNHSAGSSKKI
jgi:hypothetical protein